MNIARRGENIQNELFQALTGYGWEPILIPLI